MDVVFVGQEWILFAANAGEEYAQYVETWYHKWRKGYDQWVVDPHGSSNWDGDELDAQKTEDDAYGEGSGVAHEDFFLIFGFAEDIVDEKWHDNT